MPAMGELTQEMEDLKKAFQTIEKENRELKARLQGFETAPSYEDLRKKCEEKEQACNYLRRELKLRDDELQKQSQEHKELCADWRREKLRADQAESNMEILVERIARLRSRMLDAKNVIEVALKEVS